MIDLEILESLLDYNADSGEIKWTYANSKNTNKGKVAGTKLSNKYIRIFIYGKLYQAHRLAWYMYYGKEPEYGLDHIDGNKHNKAIDNLRDIPQSGNAKNSSLSKANSSGFTGVTFMRRSKKWRSRIMVDGSDIHLGFYDDKQKAISARVRANRKYGFHENHGKI